MSRSIVTRLAGAFGFAFAGASHAAVFINEIHYDDSTAAADVGEAVEVTATAGENLSLYTIVPYNGSTGQTYTPSGTPGPGSLVTCGATVTIGVFPVLGLQNGAPDGIALVLNGTTVVQFLSYEGTFAASNGPANGMTSVDIMRSESNSTTPGTSLQLSGSGAAYADFAWQPSADDNFGACNIGQTFTGGGGGDVDPEVQSIDPADGAIDVPANKTLTVTFNKDVTTTGEWFTLSCTTSGVRNVADTTVGGTVAVRTIDPMADFTAEENCTLTIDPLLVTDDDGGNDTLVGNDRFSFTVAAAPVDVPPTVDSITPAAGATNVATNANIIVKFSEPVTTSAAAFALTCGGSPHPFTLSGGPGIWTLDPDVDFDEVETCQLVIDDDQVLDQDGAIQAMVDDFLSSFTTRAGAGDYYAGVDASSCVALRTTLHALIDDHTAFPYTHATLDDTWTVLEKADQDPLDSSRVLEVYENVSYAKAGGGNSNYNREHTWPNSYGFNNLSGVSPGGVPQSSAYTDTHMLYLSDIEYNSDRGSKPYATCSASCSINATQVYNGFGGGSQTYPGSHNWYLVAGSEPQGSYEVWNHRRGDMARAVLYMDVRYEGGTATGGNTIGQSEPDLVVTDNRTLISNSASTTGGTAYMGLKSALIAWHNSDAPDAHELLRNDVVFSYQGNRNPFIDHPEWVAIAFADPCTGTPPSNQAPTLNDVSVAVLENAPATTNVTTLAGTDPNAGQTLAYSIVSGNASGAFAINSGTGAVNVASAALIDRSVAASYSLVVRATDNGTPAMSDDATLSISITQVNDAPSFTKGADQSVNEDAGAQNVPGWATSISAGPSDESTQSLTFAVTANTNAPLFAAAPAVAANGTLSYTPAANASGTATITLRVTDNGGTANGGVDASATQDFTITVAAVNDAPSFTKGADATVAQNAGAQTIVGWATAIGAGPANEAGQVVTFEVTNNSNAALFSAPPAVASNGTLTYTPAAGAFGTAMITLRARDDGGTANGGVDASATQSFTINVTQVVNQAAVANDDAPAAVLEDASATAFAVLGNDTDAESDPFVVTAVTQPANGTAAIGPAGANVTFTPAADFCGATSFTYTITGGDTATVNVTVTCVNDAPVLDDVTLTIAAGAANGTLLAALAAIDVDGPALSYSITNGNTGSAFGVNPTTGALTVATSGAVTAGTFTLTITASDGMLSDTATITITVTAPPADALFGNGFE